MALATSIQDSWNQLERWTGRQLSGARNEARLISARADALRLAITLSEGLAVYRILRDFQHLDLNEVVNDIVAVLRQCLIVMLTSTGGGALIGGVAGGVFGVGVGAAPGVVIGAAAGAQMGEWILIFMGLKALSEYIVRDMPDIARAYWDGIRLAWSAASPSPLPQQPVRVDRFAIQHAAEKIARAHVAMFVLLLMGILAYLAKGRSDMGQLAESVRGSRIGPKFADWMVRNEGRLKAEPRLREQTATQSTPSADKWSDRAREAPKAKQGPAQRASKPTISANPEPSNRLTAGKGKPIKMDGHKIYDSNFQPLSTNPKAQYRFSDPTFRQTGGDVYFGDNVATSYAEVRKNIAGKSLYVGELNVDNVLDLTDHETIKMMGIDGARLTAPVNSQIEQKLVYGYTNKIANKAYTAGYNGILYPSSRNATGKALVLFGGRYDQTAISTIIDATIP